MSVHNHQQLKPYVGQRCPSSRCCAPCYHDTSSHLEEDKVAGQVEAGAVAFPAPSSSFLSYSSKWLQAVVIAGPRCVIVVAWCFWQERVFNDFITFCHDSCPETAGFICGWNGYLSWDEFCPRIIMLPFARGNYRRMYIKGFQDNNALQGSGNTVRHISLYLSCPCGSGQERAGGNSPHRSDSLLWPVLGAFASLALLCWERDWRWIQWQEVNDKMWEEVQLSSCITLASHWQMGGRRVLNGCLEA